MLSVFTVSLVNRLSGAQVRRGQPIVWFVLACYLSLLAIGAEPVLRTMAESDRTPHKVQAK
jgi:hypothetical protein